MLNGRREPAEAPLVLPANGVAGDFNRTGHEQAADGGRTAPHGESENHDGVDGEVNHNGVNGDLEPLMGRAAKFAERYPAPPLVAAGEEMISGAPDAFQLLAFKLTAWAAQHD